MSFQNHIPFLVIFAPKTGPFINTGFKIDLILLQKEAK